MAIINSCCCWRSLRRGCYAAAAYTIVYFSVTIVTMGHFIEVEQRYLSGEMEDPESESFLEPEKITPVTVGLNITLLACSTLGLVSCVLLMVGVYKSSDLPLIDIWMFYCASSLVVLGTLPFLRCDVTNTEQHKDVKYLLLPWIAAMGLETLVECINLVYLFYLQTVNFNPITSFLFTLDFFIFILNGYGLVCVISQFQEYLDGRGTAASEENDGVGAVQYTATAQQTTSSSSAPSSRRRSAARPAASRADPDAFSEAPTKTFTSVLSKPSRSAVKKHVQFPDEQSRIEEATEIPAREVDEKPDARVISSLWMDLESEAEVPER